MTSRKDYELVAKAFRTGSIEQQLDALCLVFKKDNPQFQPDLFRYKCSPDYKK